MLTGPVTAVPLLLFAAAARRIPLVTVGLLQFIAPVMQLLASLALGEYISAGPVGRVRHRLAGSLAVLTIDSCMPACAADPMRRHTGRQASPSSWASSHR